MKLSENFTWEEFIYSDVARVKGITNMPPEEVREEMIQNAKNLCENLLQKIRDEVGPLTISSGYRSPNLNKIIKGSESSQHSKGMAADILCPRLSSLQLAHLIRNKFKFDQLIYEKRLNKTTGKPYDWVHVSWVSEEKNRNQVLNSPISGGYVYGLPSK